MFGNADCTSSCVMSEAAPLAGTVQQPRPPDATTARNIETVAAIEAASQASRGSLDRVSARISRFASTTRFILLHVVWFAGWVVTNSLVESPIDPYPFTFLTLLTSLEAIFLSSFVLISQSQLEHVAGRRAELDLQINLLAEAEMTKVLAAVQAIAEHLGVAAVAADPKARELAVDTDVPALMQALEVVAEARTARE